MEAEGPESTVAAGLERPTAAETEITRLSVLVACASVLQVAEALLPYPVPGIRLGLANMVTLIALVELSPGNAFRLALLRSLISSLILGTFLTPSFVLSFSGAMVSAGLMVACYRLSAVGIRFSLIGISVAGSVAHVLTQVAVVYLVFVHNPVVLLLAPWLALSGVVMGVVTGLVAVQVCRRLDERPAPVPLVSAPRAPDVEQPGGRYVPRYSVVHRLRPELKIGAALVLALAVVIARDFVFYLCVLAALAGLTALAKVPFASLTYNLRRLASFILISFFLPLLFTPAGTVLFALGPLRVTLHGLATGGILTFRIVLLFFATSLLALTTSPSDIASGLERLLEPLRPLRLDSRRIARVLALSWSFFPVLWQQAEAMVRLTVAAWRGFSGRRRLVAVASFLPDLVTMLYTEAERLAANSGIAEPD